MNKLVNNSIMMVITVLLNFSSLFSQNSALSGSIQGKIVDLDTKEALPGANIVIINTVMGAASDLDGNYIIQNLPVGSYSLKISFIGYETVIKTDVIVKSRRITRIDGELKLSALETKGVEITGGYFSQVAEQPTSVVNFSHEEIRRAPGSAGDISRIVMSLPSVAKVNDQTNNLIVRGGSPVENAFFVDNIEIPNINHFPTQGASGGPIGLLSVDFIQDVNFYTGGFSVIYGDRLSSIMDITFREGNRQEFDGQLDFNFAGIGGVAEGPIFHQKGSWLFSARRSYLDILANYIDIGSTKPPRYGDYQGKIVFDLNKNHKLMLLGIFGYDHNRPDRETAVENDMIYYGNQDLFENTAGLNWRALWNKNGYSNTSLAFTSQQFKEDFYETNRDLFLIKNHSQEQELKLRNVNHFRLNSKHSIEFGADIKYLNSGYDNFYAEYTDTLGDTTKSLLLNEKIISQKAGAFLNLISEPFSRLKTTFGIRVDHFSLNKKVHFSPRFGLSYQINNRTTLNASTGVFYQNLPMIFISQNTEHRDLNDPVAIHYIVGMNFLITENTRFSLEVYQKNYRHFPLDPDQPGLFLIDELFYRYGFFFNHERLVDTGKARARGVELMIQKKLAKNFYGLISTSCFQTQYEVQNGVWRNRVFDNRFIFSAEGGYKPDRNWEFSLRWIYAGGSPFTPFNLEASEMLYQAVLDENRINQERYPAYHSLNLRFDRRFNFHTTNLIFYFSAWNAYNRKNVATYFWNEQKNQPGTIYQWNLLPIIGLEYEF
ncbi:TonB-dependent receptor [candidate division KSB1 bacterium]|nr:TonB-dependent receptor [candidate division KSB1 bacterium]